jgi:hypothetical protein
MMRFSVFGTGILAVVFAASTIRAQQPAAGRQDGGASGMMPAGHEMPMGASMTSPMSQADKIANAMTAGPSSVSAQATIRDFPEKDGETPPVLRTGTNGWTCFPDMPMSQGNDPMCLDQSWLKWMDAYLAHKAPAITSVGIGYMLASGGGWGSNSDPFAMAETPTNHWGLHPPHVMILVPDAKALSMVSTDPANGGPYVMWAGTPYAHIMAPIAAAAPMGHR